MNERYREVSDTPGNAKRAPLRGARWGKTRPPCVAKVSDGGPAGGQAAAVAIFRSRVSASRSSLRARSRPMP
ncbi:hypothetical protein Pmi06nite_43590 [Planotetraspora mira]|uniref:Uncharacterized protein n=1 Tax=Planotetraspora mira TaxID=58121 RepID=A0A8J3TRU3_9ACTN|nr:hypothetical protein Pmi06nite_43590 [Planotetraspora mira]